MSLTFFSSELISVLRSKTRMLWRLLKSFLEIDLKRLSRNRTWSSGASSLAGCSFSFVNMRDNLQTKRLVLLPLPRSLMSGRPTRPPAYTLLGSDHTQTSLPQFLSLSTTATNLRISQLGNPLVFDRYFQAHQNWVWVNCAAAFCDPCLKYPHILLLQRQLLKASISFPCKHTANHFERQQKSTTFAHHVLS